MMCYVIAYYRFQMKPLKIQQSVIAYFNWTGVASLPYFSEDDSAESSNAEDEEESEAGETEPDTEEAFLDEQLERRSNGGSSGPRPNLAPQHMQWALRQREPGRGPITTSGRLGMSKFQFLLF